MAAVSGTAPPLAAVSETTNGSSGGSASGSTAAPSDGSLAHHGVQLLLTNQFTAAQKLYAERFNSDPKVALLHSFLSYGTAISSYSESDLKACIDSCKRTEAIGERLEKAGKKEEGGKRIEGMLIQADCDLLTACVNLVQEEYVKMMWHMRKSYNLYQDVNKLVDRYQGPGRQELAGWARYGTGLFNLLLSQLPPAVMSFAEFVGYEGDRDKGLKLLSECQQGSSFNAPFAALLLLVYYLTIAPLTGDEVPGGMEHAKRLIDVGNPQWAHQRYPNGAFFALMESRYYRAMNETRKAIDIATAAAKNVFELPSAEILFHYQTAWCYFFCLDWQHSAEDFDKMLHSTPGGSYLPPGSAKVAAAAAAVKQKEPTQASAQGCYAYQIGLCYAMLGDWHRAAWYMESVPVWLKKAGGTPKEVDKYAKRKAAEFLQRKRQQTEDVLLDVMDLLHAWNGYSQMPKDALDTAQQQLTQARPKLTEAEDVLRWELANAAILDTRQQFRAAYDKLRPLADAQKATLKSSKCKKSGLTPFFYYELAFAAFGCGQVSEAKEWHKKSAKCEDYDLFRQLAVRLHTLKLKIKAAEAKGKK